MFRCMTVFLSIVALSFGPVLSASYAETRTVALGQADQQTSVEAVAHYARARALLIAALNEFDTARKIARPDELLDPVKWRNTLIDRAEDLERVLDPQPKATRGGIKFSADPRLLPEAKR
jgi:hypothetical protein